MNKMQIEDLKLLLERLHVKPNKNLGQNFLIDENITLKIISKSKISESDTILEIGAGLGALTKELVKLPNNILTYEIDPKLYEYLKQRFQDHENVQIFNEDILTANIPFHDKVISNIPYTITGPIFEKIFYKNNAPSGVLIIEKSLADRLYNENIYDKISRITISFNSFMELTHQSDISPQCFHPAPKIELSLITIQPKKQVNEFLKTNETRTFYLDFIAGIMPYKNKSILNAIKLYLKRESVMHVTNNQILCVLNQIDVKNTKVFKIRINDFINVSKELHKLIASV